MTLAQRPTETLTLPDTTRDLVEASVSPNTRRAYAGVWHRFDEFQRNRLGGLEADDAGVATYLTGLFESGRSPATAGVVVAALRFRARHGGAPDPVGPLSERVLAGFRRAGVGRGRGQVAGVGWAQSDAAAALSARAGLAGLRDAALIAVASDALLRVSEIAALQVSDLDWGTSTVTVQRSKTDQEGEGAVLYLGKPTLRRVREWLDAARIDEGPLFRPVSKSGLVSARALSARSVRQIIKDRAEAAGVEGRVSGHSLRVGAAQSLAQAGASLVEMQQAGRWESPAMPGHYARAELASRGAVARLRYRR